MFTLTRALGLWTAQIYSSAHGVCYIGTGSSAAIAIAQAVRDMNSTTVIVLG